MNSLEINFSFFTNNWMYIIGGLIVIFVIYFIILAKISGSQKKAQQDEIRSRLKNPELTNAQKRLLAFGAVLFVHRFEKVTEIIPEDNIKAHIYGLKSWWGIEDSETAKAVIEDVLSLRKTAELDEFLHNESETQDEEEISVEQVRKTIADELKMDVTRIEAIESVYAWDIMRAVSLAKWAFWCGYLNENEMWNYMTIASKIATEIGKDWEEYVISFLLGRTLHGFDLDDIVVEAKWLLQHESLRDKEPNPYKIYKFKN